MTSGAAHSDMEVSNMDFPHLKDTKFPDLGTVDVYQYRNEFDYKRWSEDSHIKLVNVIWNFDYRNVVKFETDNARDNWFNSIADYYALDLSQAARIVPDNYVKLPIPYDVMALYNYLIVDIPIATSESAPLDYETETGIRRWHFFINDIAYLSPNSTQVYLQLDVWTQYQNSVEINYMMLERGHAPVAASDVDAYLANPIANNRYLLAPDVNYDNASITRRADYVPFGNGTKLVCLASTCAPDQIAQLGTVNADPAYNPLGQITYSDVQARYGHQLQVNGLTIGNGRDYSNARTPARAGISSDGILANNLSVYAIAASECYGNGTFFADVVSTCPQFLNTVQACFVVDEDCVTLGARYQIAGHTIYKCEGTSRNLLDRRLQKSDFAYPTELQRFAKLYTSPYSRIEITDNDGTTYEVNIEETSTLQAKSVVSVAFPYIDYRVYIDGIGGSGATRYSWVDLSGNAEALDMPNSDWFKYCFDWKIPTFALYMDGQTAYQLSTFNRNTKMGINNALVAYHNSMRSANTAMENAIDTADATLANVYDSTTTAKANAAASADTAKANADNTADTNKVNADNTADTNKTNADNSADTAYNCTERGREEFVYNAIQGDSAMMQTEQRNINAASTLASYNVAYNTAELAVTNVISQATTQFEINTSLAQANNAADSAIGTSTVNGVIGGSMQAINADSTYAKGASVFLGGIGGFASGLISAHYTKANATIGAQMSQASRDLIAAKNSGMNTLANNQTTDVTTEENAAKYDNYVTAAQFSTNRRVKTSDTITANETEVRATTKTNASNTQATAKANAANTQATAKTNATNTQTTSKANATRNYDNDRGNAARTRDNIAANSGYTREVSELNAKELLENAARNAMAGTLDSRNAKPVSIGATSGNAAADAMRTRGIQIKVKTQSDSAIRQAGDAFARFGYALNQVWDVRASGLCLMENFTYWKASDIWVDDRQSSNNLVQARFERIFRDGVTVWSDPEKIGRVSIYDN